MIFSRLFQRVIIRDPDGISDTHYNVSVFRLVEWSFTKIRIYPRRREKFRGKWLTLNPMTLLGNFLLNYFPMDFHAYISEINTRHCSEGIFPVISENGQKQSMRFSIFPFTVNKIYFPIVCIPHFTMEYIHIFQISPDSANLRWEDTMATELDLQYCGKQWFCVFLIFPILSRYFSLNKRSLFSIFMNKLSLKSQFLNFFSIYRV